MVINGSLDEVAVPGFPGYTPPFGTKKADGQPVSSREHNENILLPFKRQRPIEVIEDSLADGIESHLAFDIKAAGITLSLGNAAFTGCRVKIYNTSGGAASAVFSGEARTLDGGESLELEWAGGGWKLNNPANRIVGEYRYFSRPLAPIELARNRLLELNYQIIEIALYQELCGLKWVGAGNNDAALWWYKCDENGVRDVNGLYMRVEDARGLFFRAAGANAVNTAASGTPYDGGAIGSFLGDAIREIYAEFDGGMTGSIYTYGAMRMYPSNKPTSSNSGNSGWVFQFLSSLVVPTASENRPASISVYPVISY